MVFPTTSILDDFNRANEGPPPSASWSQGWSGLLGEWQVTGNQCTANITLGFCENYWNTSFNADMEAYATMATRPADGESFSLFVRVVDIGGVNPDGYNIRFVRDDADSDTLEILRVDDGSGATLGAVVNQDLSDGDSIGIRAIGDRFEAWINTGAGWTKLFDRTDGTYSAGGVIDLITSSATTVVDDFGGGNYVRDTFNTDSTRLGLFNGMGFRMNRQGVS